ncbi:GlyGly-CTERM sorting domain-containing protein [Photobacterium profundum]|uniref:zinc-dependent metalloprotease family protein n=1 Tax=Photobacterium profundum TaxID=74109 RepID=UPI003D0F3BA3
MKKTTLALGLAALLSTTAQAAVFESTLYTPSDMPATSLSQSIVGYYYAMDLANKTFAANNVDVQLKPARFKPVADYTSEAAVVPSKNIMADLLVFNTITTDTYYNVVIGNNSGNANGAANIAYSDDDLTNFINFTVMGVATQTLLAADSNVDNFVFTHEVGHTLGGQHDVSNIPVDALGLYTNAYAVPDCGNGESSLVAEDGAAIARASLPLISGASGCQVGSANNVAVMNHVIELEKNDKPLIGNQTLSVDVVENTNTQMFELTVTRTDTTNADTAKVYIAGTQDSTALTAISVSFDVGIATSSVASVPFDKIHPMFDASVSYASVYAVALTDTEVVPALTDLKDFNTVWVKKVEVDNGTSGGESSGGSGGSTSIFLIVMMGAIGLFRRK